MTMDLRKKIALVVTLMIASGCATHQLAPGADITGISVTVDDPANPRRVRFDVDTALLLGNPGDQRMPVTLRARIATRELAARELDSRGLCRHGFSGPEGIHFPEGDRAHSSFVVRCNA